MCNRLDKPLVSVRILTYNSSKYIIETLNSVFNQTYQNLELVVSDDCSTDNTVQLCKDWIDKHKVRFSKIVFLTTTVNTGVCANSKRSLEATTGDWIKGLGGDDVLHPEAIERFIAFVQREKCEICASSMDYMDDESNPLDVDLGGRYDDYMKILELPYRKQFRLSKQYIIVPGPVLFYSRKVYEKTSGPNPRYGTADEWSFLYATLKNGFRIFPCHEILIRYRIRNTSLTRSITNWQSSKPAQYGRLFMKEVLMPDVIRSGNIFIWWHLYIKYLMWGDVRFKYLSLVDVLWYVEKIKSKIK